MKFTVNIAMYIVKRTMWPWH